MSYPSLPRRLSQHRIVPELDTLRPIGWLVTLITLALCASLLSSCKNPPPETDQLELVFADASTVWWTAPTILARTEGLFDDNLKLTTFDVTSGLASKNAVVAGNADIGLVASTPLALGRYSGENTLVLCSYVQSDQLLALISSQEELTTAKQLSPVAIVPGTISQFYLLRYLESAKISDLPNLNELHGRPPDIPNMFLKSSASSAVIWEPFVSNIEIEAARKGIKAHTHRKGGIYELRLYLITRPDVFEDPRKRAAIAAFLRGVDRASKLLEEGAGRARLESHFEYKDGRLLPIINEVIFGVKTDFERMAQLIAEDSELAIRTGIVEDVEPLSEASLQSLFVDPAWVEGALSSNQQ